MMIIYVVENISNGELGVGAIGAIFATNSVMLGIILSTYAFLLLLKSTESTTVNTQKVFFTGVLLALITTAFFFMTLIAAFTVFDQMQDDINLEVIQLLSITGIWTLWFYILFVSVFFSLFVIIWNWRLIVSKYRATTSSEKKHILIMLNHTFSLLILGSVISTIATFAQWNVIYDIAVLVSELAFCGFTYIYIKNGGTTLGNDNLRVLLIVNSEGNLLFEYNFNGFNNSSSSSLSAIKAVSIILDEYTDSSERLLSIQLDDNSLLFQTIDEELTILLLIKQPTQYDQDRLLSFTSVIRNNLESLYEDTIFEEGQEYLNSEIKKIFV